MILLSYIQVVKENNSIIKNLANTYEQNSWDKTIVSSTHQDVSYVKWQLADVEQLWSLPFSSSFLILLFQKYLLFGLNVKIS